VVAWVIAIESLVLVKEITVGDETAVNVAIRKVDGRLALVLDMANFFA